VQGITQGKELVQYDFTPEQYQALINLPHSLPRLSKIKCDYPRDAEGKLIAANCPTSTQGGTKACLGTSTSRQTRPIRDQLCNGTTDQDAAGFCTGVFRNGDQTSLGHMRENFEEASPLKLLLLILCLSFEATQSGLNNAEAKLAIIPCDSPKHS